MAPKKPTGPRRYHRAEGCDPVSGDRAFHAAEFDFGTAREDADNQAVFAAFLAKVKAKTQQDAP
jgi:hypothetical protein